MKGEVSFKDYLKTTYFDALMRHASKALVEALPIPDRVRALKTWRDNVIRELAKEGRITDAGKFLPYIDELLRSNGEAVAVAPKRSKEEILDIVRKELEKFKKDSLERIWKTFEFQLDIFTDGLKGLVAKKNLNTQTVSALLDRASQSKPSMLCARRGLAMNDPAINIEGLSLPSKDSLGVIAKPDIATKPIAETREIAPRAEVRIDVPLRAVIAKTDLGQVIDVKRGVIPNAELIPALQGLEQEIFKYPVTYEQWRNRLTEEYTLLLLVDDEGEPKAFIYAEPVEKMFLKQSEAKMMINLIGSLDDGVEGRGTLLMDLFLEKMIRNGNRSIIWDSLPSARWFYDGDGTAEHPGYLRKGAEAGTFEIIKTPTEKTAKSGLRQDDGQDYEIKLLKSPLEAGPAIGTTRDELRSSSWKTIAIAGALMFSAMVAWGRDQVFKPESAVKIEAAIEAFGPQFPSGNVFGPDHQAVITDVQKELVRSGYLAPINKSTGRSNVDGLWGSATDDALARALADGKTLNDIETSSDEVPVSGDDPLDGKNLNSDDVASARTLLSQIKGFEHIAKIGPYDATLGQEIRDFQSRYLAAAKLPKDGKLYWGKSSRDAAGKVIKAQGSAISSVQAAFLGVSITNAIGTVAPAGPISAGNRIAILLGTPRDRETIVRAALDAEKISRGITQQERVRKASASIRSTIDDIYPSLTPAEKAGLHNLVLYSTFLESKMGYWKIQRNGKGEPILVAVGDSQIELATLGDFVQNYLLRPSNKSVADKIAMRLGLGSQMELKVVWDAILLGQAKNQKLARKEMGKAIALRMLKIENGTLSDLSNAFAAMMFKRSSGV
jgi:hypothetical protein